MNKTKIYVIAVIISIVLLIAVLIAGPILLPVEKDVGEFNSEEMAIFYVYAPVFFAVLALLVIFSFLLIKTLSGSVSVKKTAPSTKSMGKTARTAIFMTLSFVLAIVFGILGMIAEKNGLVSKNGLTNTLFIVCVIVPILLLIFNFIMGVVLKKKINGQSESEKLRLFVSQREMTEEMRNEKLLSLKRLRIITLIYSCLLVALGIVLSFLAGVINPESWVVVVLAEGGFVILAGLSRFSFKTRLKTDKEEEGYVSRKDYPYLYSLADKAKKAILNDKIGIKIVIAPNDNVGIAQTSDAYYLCIGMILFSILSEDELYAIMLHEFSHVRSEINSKMIKEREYLLKTGSSVLTLINLFYVYIDTLYEFDYFLYDHASSVYAEIEADKAMLKCGSKETVSSALIKTSYYGFFRWETKSYDSGSEYSDPEPPKLPMTNEIKKFKDRLAIRKNDWDALADKRILALSDSHPTLKMRLDALGITEHTASFSDDSVEFGSEKQKALGLADRLIGVYLKETYENSRKEKYLDCLEVVRKWTEEGRPLKAEEYSDIVAAFLQLGKASEAEKLCDRAIAELPRYSSAFALFIKGNLLLGRYDDKGIDLLYESIEINNNSIDGSLDLIGEYCVMTGNQKELDIYREKAVAIVQKQRDVYDKAGELGPKDDLRAETLPDGVLDRILEYIKSVEEGTLENVYLVRKTITEKDFTSAFILKFYVDVLDEKKSEIYTKIFNYLDTSDDWQYSLFLYEDVYQAKFEKIPGSCVYTGKHIGEENKK